MRSFGMTLNEETVNDLVLLKKTLVNDYGIPRWAASFGVCDYRLGIGLKRLAKDSEYPNGRFLMADTQTEWTTISPFLYNIPKTHSFYVFIQEIGKFLSPKLTILEPGKPALNITSDSISETQKRKHHAKSRGRCKQNIKTEELAKKLRLGESIERTEKDTQILEQFKKDIKEINSEIMVCSEVKVLCPCGTYLKLPVSKAGKASYIKHGNHVKSCKFLASTSTKVKQQTIIELFNSIRTEEGDASRHTDEEVNGSNEDQSNENLESNLEPVENVDLEPTDIIIEPDWSFEDYSNKAEYENMDLETNAILDMPEIMDSTENDELVETDLDIENDIVIESLYDSDSDSDPDRRFAEYFEELDQAVVKLQRMISNGTLSKNHIFYKLVDNALSFAVSDGNKDNEINFQWDPLIVSFCNTITFHGGEKVLNILRGPGQLGSGSKGTHAFCWDDYNFPLPGLNTRKRSARGYSTSSGILKPLLHSYIQFSHNNAEVKPLIENKNEVVYPVSIAMDGMAITPGLVFDSRQGLVLGTTKNIDITFVEEHPNPNYETMKTTFITEVESIILTSMDGMASLPVGLNYTNKTISGQEMAEKVIDHKSKIETCINCLNDCEIDENVMQTTFCCYPGQDNKPNGDMTALHACKKCTELGIKCIRLQVVVLASDCEEKNKKAMEIVTEDEKNIIAVPEAVHTTKCLKGSFGNWWLVCQDTRINMSQLRTVRMQNDSLKRLIPLDAVRHKDRMDVESCLQISRPSVRRILQKFSVISQVIVPEKYRFWESNRPGVMSNPVALSQLDLSRYFVLDAVGKLFQLKLHYPAEITLVDGTLQSPVGITYLQNGLLFVSEPQTKTMSVIDISGHNFCHFDTMTVAQIKAELKRHDKLTGNLKNAKKVDLLSALKETFKNSGISPTKPTYVGKLPYRKYLVKANDNIIPGIICADLKQNNIFVSDVSTNDIILLSVESNGFEVRTHLLTRYLCNASYITSVCCDNTFIFAIAGGVDGGLMRINRNTHTTTNVIRNSEANDLLAVACNETSFAVTDNQTGSIYVYEKSTTKKQFVCGSGMKQASDGFKTSFVQPSALSFNLSGTLVVCDAAVGQVIKMVSLNTVGLVDYLEALYLLDHTFGVHITGEPKPKLSLDDAISKLEHVTDILSSISANVHKLLPLNRLVTQGPDGTPASKTIKSVQMIVDGVKQIQKFISSVNSDYVIDLSSILTLVCEHLFSTLRSKTPMPDVLEVSRLFGNVLRENMKKLTDCGFIYFTNRKSFYIAPNGHKSIPKLEQLACPDSRKLPIEQRQKMRNWAAEHGKKVRQNTIRNTSTKDRPGTLPLNVYINYKEPDPNPVCFESLTSIEGDNASVIFAIKHSESLAIVETTRRTENDEDQNFGRLYLSSVTCLTFVATDDVQFYKKDIIVELNEDQYQKTNDNILITDDIYAKIQTLFNDNGPRVIEAEIEPNRDISSDEEAYDSLPLRRSRGGRLIKFNRNFNDYVVL